jgi:methylmalonyl-CoA mutase cobalamin-binding domain/chain
MGSEKKQNALNLLEQAVREHDPDAMNKAIDQALEQGVAKNEIRQALFQGLEQQRRKMLGPEAPLPKFLLSIDVVHEGLKRLSAGDESAKSGAIPLVIGVVEGDPHDLGKNIISKIYSASGYQVFDLGVQVPVEAFVKSVTEKKAKVLAISSMISTTMVQMPEIIKRVKAIAPETVIMVGGAPLDAKLAKSFGADGYAESAVTVLEETEAALERMSAKEKWQ